VTSVIFSNPGGDDDVGVAARHRQDPLAEGEAPGGAGGLDPGAGDVETGEASAVAYQGSDMLLLDETAAAHVPYV